MLNEVQFCHQIMDKKNELIKTISTRLTVEFKMKWIKWVWIESFQLWNGLISALLWNAIQYSVEVFFFTFFILLHHSLQFHLSHFCCISLSFSVFLTPPVHFPHFTNKYSNKLEIECSSKMLLWIKLLVTSIFDLLLHLHFYNTCHKLPQSIMLFIITFHLSHTLWVLTLQFNKV